MCISCYPFRRISYGSTMPGPEPAGEAMRRRDFIRVAGSAAATWPFVARAQQRQSLRRVAVLEPIAKDTPGAQARYKAFLEAFDQLGWKDGRNVQIVAR